MCVNDASQSHCSLAFRYASLLPLLQVKAPARAGIIAPLNVKIPAQGTTLGPEKTSFFQALQIPTKITKGTIEILVSFVHYCLFSVCCSPWDCCVC